jgi:hypothetical protein
MKNLNLLRLAGFGFFGAVFLSPAVPGQNEDWLLEKLNVAKRLTSLPFTMSALYRENYLTEPKTTVLPSGSTTKPDFFLSILLPDDPPVDTVPLLLPTYDPLANTSTSMETSAIEIMPTEKRTQIESKSIQSENIEEQKPDPAEDTFSGNVDQAPNKIKTEAKEEFENAEETGNINNTHLPEYVPGEQAPEEELLPPTQYVDEVLMPKRIHREKISNSVIVPIITTEPEAGLDAYSSDLMEARIQDLADFANENDYSTEYAFMINLGLKSGKKRFFLVDLRTGTIVNSGLVAHGRGKEKFTLNKHYSNVSGSSCSSLGLYKVGSVYNGGFGKSFRLIGLQKTNSNALSRAIVLHAMNCIPNEEIDYPICQSEGCPSLSPDFLESISPVIKKSMKPMLLWIFDPTIDRDHIP